MPATASHPPRSSTATFAAWVLLALALAAVLAWYLRDLEHRVIAQAWVNESTGDSPRPIAEVASAVRQLKLVTVEINTSVEVESSDTSWRGDASAKVKVPVKLFYGTDLSQMKIDAISLSPLTGAYIVRVPKPHRISTEVFGGDEQADVNVGWARMRSRAGEFHLGQARKSVSDQARKMVLSQEDAKKVAEATREQVSKLIASVVGGTGGTRLIEVHLDESETP